MESSRPSHMHEAGAGAHAQGEWYAVRDACLAEAERTGSAEAYERLGNAAWRLQDTNGMLNARLTAYRLYRARGADVEAARVAIALGNDFLDFRGDPAVANGWLRRAARLLAQQPPSADHAWLRTWEARLALIGRQDAQGALEAAEEAIALARACDCADAEVLALAMSGSAHVAAGNTAEGMAQLDEAAAAALGGDVADSYAAGLTCCYLISACERVRDYERAAQWCARLREFSTRQRFMMLLTLCRLQYGSVLMSSGAWADAERELEAAIEELSTTRPVVLPAAYARLGELRRRQGRTEDACALFAQAGNHPMAQLGSGWIELQRGDSAAALDRARGYLRRFPAHALLERAAGNELLVHCATALGDPAEARRALAAIEEAAQTHRLGTLRGMALAAAGTIALAERAYDHAAQLFEDAADTFDQCGFPWEAALARRQQAAALEPPPPQRALGTPLTERELEVLRLVADGLTERDIATRLVLSQHTVHRHISNIRLKLGVVSRAAAVAQALRDRLL